jgi:hypothetical protein
MIANMRKLEHFDAEVAKLAAERLEVFIKAQVSKGLDPYGKAWPLKVDGKQALVNAAAAVRVEARGSLIVAIVEGVEYWHQVAKEDGCSPPRRQLIPTTGSPLPDAWEEVIASARDEVFARMTEAA